MIDRVYSRAGKDSYERAIIPVKNLGLIVIFLDQAEHSSWGLEICSQKVVSCKPSDETYDIGED